MVIDMLTKREEYGLTFSKWIEPESNEPYNICSRDEVGVYSHLTFIRYLNVGELNAIIEEITNAQNGQIYDSLPYSVK
jgi:hypothetical protein